MTPVRPPDYDIVPTTADVGFEVHAADRPTLFADAVRAFFDVMVEGGLASIQAVEEHRVEVDGVDDGDLLVALLSRCLYLLEVEGWLFAQAEVESLDEGRVALRLRGEHVDESRHAFALAVKAVTYHDLEVGPDPTRPGTWRARVIVDI